MQNYIYLILFLIFWLFFWKYIIKEIFQIIFGYWIPFVPTSDIKLKALIKNLSLKKNDKFLDLWSWDWKILQEIEKNFKWVKTYWIENSYFPYKESIERKQKNNLNYKIYKKNFFSHNFWEYDVIYCYILWYLMKKVWKKMKKECKPWTLLYSNSFEIKNEKPIKKIKTTKNRFLYVYQV